MTERDAFLREIGAYPEDDALRLIFSDWLEENGDPERAEFIRIQCELGSCKLSEESRHPLRIRERALEQIAFLIESTPAESVEEITNTPSTTSL